MIQRKAVHLCLGLLLTTTVLADSRKDVLDILNQSASVIGSEDAKSWRIFFDACLEITPPPMTTGDPLSMKTVWPGMFQWQEVAMWAAQNEHMEAAFLVSAKRALVGLPYGSEEVPANYLEHGIVAEIGVDGQLHRLDFGYINMVELACLWATAETYRLFEEGDNDRAIKLMLSELVVLRMFCDREFLKEQLTFMPMLGDALSNTRDVFYTYRESILTPKFRAIAKEAIPYLRTDPTRLLMPDGDRIVGEAIIKDLFDTVGEADPDKFREVLTDIQSDLEPLTRFGAARHWEEIALKHHRGRDDSLKRLNLIYDDWWRRWKMRAFHPQLKIDTELKKSNSVKYAAVNLVIRDIQELFKQRDLVATEINGTAVAAALCGYKNHFGVFPARIKMLYAQLLHRMSNLDPFKSLSLRPQKSGVPSDWTLYSASVGPLQYRQIEDKLKIKTKSGDVWVDQNESLLYSVAIDDEDNRGLNAATDMILWPPLKTLKRNAGLLD
ncbi:MAG TPA: hypothetical protein EYM64_04385 [Phycisphaerales bacterium]|nr:hypothetical protein [Phycisphaerales bacterium]